MAKYRVLAKSYINSSIVEAGEVVEYDGTPGKALELIEEAVEDAAPAEAKAKAGKAGKKAASPVAPESTGDAGADLV